MDFLSIKSNFCPPISCSFILHRLFSQHKSLGIKCNVSNSLHDKWGTNCEIWSPHSSIDEDSVLLGMLCCVDLDIVSDVWSSLLPWSPWFKKSKRSKVCGVKVSEQRGESCCAVGGSIGWRHELAVDSTFPVTLHCSAGNFPLVY